MIHPVFIYTGVFCDTPCIYINITHLLEYYCKMSLFRYSLHLHAISLNQGHRGFKQENGGKGGEVRVNIFFVGEEFYIYFL